jgi:mannosylfructose-phosphate synthase
MQSPHRLSLLVLSTHGYVAAEPELGLPDTGGQVVFVLELAKQFAAQGHRVDIVTRHFDEQPHVDEINSDLRVWRMPYGGSDFIRKEDMHDHLDEFVATFLRESAADDLRYDLVASHYWDAGWAGQRIADALGIPHVHTPHSLGSWKRQDMGGDPDEMERKYRFEERIEKESLIFHQSDCVVATTRQQERMLRDDFEVPGSRIAMIPPGVDEERYTPVSRTEIDAVRHSLGFQEHDVYAVGRAAMNKGYDLLLQALPELRALVPDARLHLAVGANSDADRRLVEQWQRRAQDLGINEHIVWGGYIPDEEMADYYRAAAVFALPSRYEPFGMTAIEAMACGTPTVVTAHGGLAEVLEFGEHALIADPMRSCDLATVLGLPMRYPAFRERLSVAGSRFARTEFSWRNIARQTLEVFAGVLANRAGTAPG